MRLEPMNTIQEISEDGKMYALVYNHEMTADGVRFLTPTEYTLQVGLLEHPAGHTVRPHRHPNIKYNVGTTQEFLYIETGKVEATIYRDDWSIVTTFIMEAGDFALFVNGGHSFKMLEPARIVEIKQGPYPGDDKAKIFMPEHTDARTS